jgi:hypothetical protein
MTGSFGLPRRSSWFLRPTEHATQKRNRAAERNQYCAEPNEYDEGFPP